MKMKTDETHEEKKKAKKQTTQCSGEMGLQRQRSTCNPKPGPITALKWHLRGRNNKNMEG